MGDNQSTEHSFKLIGHLGKLFAKNGASKNELKELDRDLAAVTQADADSLVEAGTLELLLRYLTVDQHFDVVTKCLFALSPFDSARQGLFDLTETGISWLADHMITSTKAAKNEKQIDRAASLAKILVLYSIDGPDADLKWLTELSALLAQCLERANTQRGMQEAYTYLSVVLPSMWVSMGTNLAPVMAASIINAGCIPLLVTVAKEVQRVDLKGLPKINAEKALNLLCACNAEQPEMSLDQVDPYELATFCIDTAVKSDWVQSQELSVVLLGRMVYLQNALPEDFMENERVLGMLQHCMSTKSPALRMTAFALSCIGSETAFESVCVEASNAINDVAEGTLTSIKRLVSPTAGGMTILRWGYEVNKFAQELLRSSKLLSRMAEAVPIHLPSQLVELLSGELKEYVVGVKAANGAESPGPEEDEVPAPKRQPGRPPAARPAPAAGAASGAQADAAAGVLPSAMHAPVSAGLSGLQQPATHAGVQQPQPQQQASGSGNIYNTGVGLRPSSATPTQMLQQAQPSMHPGTSQTNNKSVARRESSTASGTSGTVAAVSSLMQTSNRSGGRTAGAPPRRGLPGATFNPVEKAIKSVAHLLPEMAVGRLGGQPAAPGMVQGKRSLGGDVMSDPKRARMDSGLMPSTSQALGGMPLQAMPLQPYQRPPLVNLPGGLHPSTAPGITNGGPIAALAAAAGVKLEPGASNPFTKTDFTSLNSFVYDLVLKSSKMEAPARTFLENVMKGMHKLPDMMNLRRKLPVAAACECDEALHRFDARARELGGKLLESKGPALDTLVQFSSSLLDELTVCHNDVKRQVN